MRTFDKITTENLDGREMQLSIFVCLTIGILGTGTGLLMYPAVFGGQVPRDRLVHVAFFGFCALCFLLASYIWDRHATIRRLRRQLDESRRRVVEVQKQASVELLNTLPDFSAFQDRLPMEFRRTAATNQKLSILVINVTLPANVSPSIEGISMLGDAAKVIFRKLREQDSIYVLAPACFGIVLPNVDLVVADRVCRRIGDGLTDAAGAGNRFSHMISVVNFPVHASSASELDQSVQELTPARRYAGFHMQLSPAEA